MRYEIEALVLELKSVASESVSESVSRSAGIENGEREGIMESPSYARGDCVER